MKRTFLSLLLLIVAVSSATLFSQEIIVAKDGAAGTYKTINEAIRSAPENSESEITILIKNGIYREKVLIDRPNITLLGESRSGVQVIYPILSTKWDEQVKMLSPEELKLQWGNGSVNLTNQANDCSLVNLTIYNNYGSTVEKTTSHQFSVFGRATRTIILGCDIFSDGNDDVALWNKDGVYYHADCYFRCTGVDYVCPRGSCFVENCRFVGNKSAQIWHDGSKDENYKFVIKNSSFDAIEPSWLGRYHHDSHFYLIGCTFSDMIIDRPIGYAYAPERKPDHMKWGHRVYFHDCQRGKRFEWAKDNLDTAPGSPTVDQITSEWCFGGRWNPMPKVERLRAKIKKVPEKPRVIATTDGEIDDQSSMIRFLMFASDYDIAGIVQVNGVQKDGHSKDKWIEAQIEQYAKVLPNLWLHDPSYPTAEYLLSKLKVGNEIREDMYKAPPLIGHTEGAQLIIDALLDDDPRPVHILAWGGANTQANALWQIKNNYPPEAWKRAVSKARLYCIWYQDGGGKWIEENLPEITIYESGAPDRDGGWRYVWDYMSVDYYFKNRLSKNPKELQAIMDKPWLTEHIKQGHGPLCAAYPQDYTSEGDTPSFMPLINNGLSQHVDYTLGGWGGRPEYKKGNHMQDGMDINPVTDTLSTHYAFQRWLPAAQNEWATRADWCVKPYHQANHPPMLKPKSQTVPTARPGEDIKLEVSAEDPDGDQITYNWWQYRDAGSYQGEVVIKQLRGEEVLITIPDDAEQGGTIHIICEVTDKGSPALTRYQRFIITVEK